MSKPPAEFSPVKAPAFIALVAGLLLSVLVTKALWQGRARARQDEVQRIALDMLLRQKGIANIILAGITTDVCVHTTIQGGVFGAVADSAELIKTLSA